ncbi:rhodanese-like domain-containing protein [Seonamhaeicola algicola]|uniref:Rhodanese-like domain-containing protein n=1 Tax=Seonamhaeicola algicola TaxID=1719036 RepID=A0A5C7AK90_9FLAO|nr:rhodanese-like domain-containing protein [Seonamhaeicola algicola]TXE06182.1 rhodanese-like domain-containing protein [Seonamhaeicola algicola]
MKQLLISLVTLTSCLGFSQKKLDKLLKQHNTESVPYMYVDSLKTTEKIILLDAREPYEFNTSHIKNAVFVGYNNFNLDSVTAKLTNKNSKIVVYCSLGIRSEDIAEKLQQIGYKNVYNLYGGIFEWKNNGNPVFNSEEKETENVHTFSKPWSKWLKKGTKIYE